MKRLLLVGACMMGLATVAHAGAIPVTFTPLTGVTGGTPQATGVFVADLSGIGIGQIASITIMDNSGGLGGSPGQFSGFDLDAVVLSTQSISNASGANGLTRAGLFNFADSILTPGTQRPPTDPALFGTSGGQVNNAIATLDAFDGNSTTAVPPAPPPNADGFVSLGDDGILSINLVIPVATGGPLFLYIGEVGDNGEVAASTITVSDIAIPEPASSLLLLTGGAALAAGGRYFHRFRPRHRDQRQGQAETAGGHAA
jgi:hypothetical protein